jgi:hypothetical protein
MPSDTAALVFLIDTANREFDALEVTDAGIWKELRSCADESAGRGLAHFGEVMVAVIDHAPIEGRIINRVDVAAIFDKAEAASLTEEGEPTDATRIIGDLWAQIEDRIPTPDYFGSASEATGYYGR